MSEVMTDGARALLCPRAWTRLPDLQATAAAGAELLRPRSGTARSGHVAWSGSAHGLIASAPPVARRSTVPIRRRQAVPKDGVLAIFAAAPDIDVDELRSDLDAAVAQDLRDPFEGTGRCRSMRPACWTPASSPL